MTEQNLMDQTDDNHELDPNTDYFTKLTGPGGKFYDPDPEVAKQKLSRGKWESDVHIRTLEQRMDELREEYLKVSAESKAGQRLQDLLDKLENKTDLTSREQPPSNEDRTPGYDPKEVESLVSSKIQEIEQTRKQSENYNLIKAKLQERFGNDYKSVLKEQAEAMDLTDDEVNQLARTKPNLFLKTFGLDEPAKLSDFRSPPKSSGVPTFTKPQKRTLAYYRKLKESNPQLYFDPKIANQMDKDSQELGTAFFDV